MAAAANSNLASVTPANFKMKRFASNFIFAALSAFAFNAFALTSNLPLFFEASQKNSEFLAHAANSEFSVTADRAQILLRRSDGKIGTVQMQLIGAQTSAPISGEAAQAGKINYFIGDASQWRTGVPTFARVRVNEIYPGINLIWHGNAQNLEYDFNLSPGAKPETIAFRFSGAEKISLNLQGELVVSVDNGEMIQRAPMAFQTVNGQRREIKAGYKILDAFTVGFAVANYDSQLPLVIDPVLSYSTYFGGNFGDSAHAIALDQNGFIYIAGETLSTVFSNALPAGSFQSQFQGGRVKGDAFIAKLDNAGTNLIYFTYLGGSADEVALGLAVNNTGNAFVTGYTDSTNFPVAHALYPNLSGKLFQGVYPVDAFVTELSSNGSALVYSTYLGGNQADIGSAIALDTDNTAYIAGYTFSTNFPVTANAFQKHLACTNSLFDNANAFVAAIAPGGTNLNYASFLGGTNFDEASSIALDPMHSVYVAGWTASTNFPTTNALIAFKYLDGSTNKKDSAFDAFVTKFQPGLTNLVYSTYLGGTNTDLAYGIAADASGNAYVVGATSSTNFPNTVVLPPFNSFVLTNISFAVATNAFLTQIKWDGTNTTIGASILFGGRGNDIANGIALDSAGNIFIVGSASSTNFPVTTNNIFGSLRATNSGPFGSSDVFVTAFSNNLSAVIYSAYLGGKKDDYGQAIAVDALDSAYVVGQTLSTNFPTFNARDTIRSGTNDAFLAKIVLNVILPQLAIQKSGTNVQVTWPPMTATEITTNTLNLQTTTNLLSTNWMTISQTPVFSGSNYIYTFDPTNAARFFRFEKF
jgi:hypothetical protein